MKIKTRRKFFLLLVLVFVIFSPLLIAYSLGYKINLSKGSLEKTGGIFIKSKTPRLSLFLNGVFTKETSLLGGGALLTKIKPGSYLLRLEKKEYQPWSKTVKVEEETVTELRGLLLFPEKITKATSTREEIELLEKNLQLEKDSPTKTLVSGIKVELNKKGELVAKETPPVLLSAKVHSFEVLNDKIIFVDKNGFLAWLDPPQKKIEVIGRPGFYLKEKSFKFIKSAREMIAIIDSMGGVFLLDDLTSAILTIDGGVKDVSFDEKGEKLLLVKENSLSILWLIDNNLQPFQKKMTREEILKSSNINMEEAKWFYGDNLHIIIRTRDGVFITELDGRGGRNTTELIAGRTDKIFTSFQNPTTIFFEKGKSWYKIEI